MSRIKDISSKAGKTAGNVWSNLPAWAKGLIVIGGVVIAYKIVKPIIKAAGNTKLDPQIRDSKQEEQGWYQQAQTDAQSKAPTMNAAQMKALANKIWTTMDGYGTRDYDLINAFKQIKNNADFSGVSAAYGVRTLQPGYGIGWMVASFKGTMIQCIEEDASSSTIDTINKYLSSKGITYQI